MNFINYTINEKRLLLRLAAAAAIPEGGCYQDGVERLQSAKTKQKEEWLAQADEDMKARVAALDRRPVNKDHAALIVLAHLGDASMLKREDGKLVHSC